MDLIYSTLEDIPTERENTLVIFTDSIPKIILGQLYIVEKRFLQELIILSYFSIKCSMFLVDQMEN